MRHVLSRKNVISCRGIELTNSTPTKTDLKGVVQGPESTVNLESGGRRGSSQGLSTLAEQPEEW